MRGALRASYEPIVPTIDDRLILRHIFARAYAEPRGRKTRAPRTPRSELPSLDGMVLVLDCETVEHRLTFGVLEIYERRRLKTRAVFYRDALQSTDPVGFVRLKTICRALGVKLVKREWLFQHAMWPARRYGWAIVGFNVAYDLSRVADSFEPATKTARYGARFCNGFELQKRFVGTKSHIIRPFCRIKRDDRHHVRFDMKAAVVIDLATAAFAHTDKNMPLMAEPPKESACRAFGVPFAVRPGAHSGEITFENVEGCLYDVRKTSELLWALDAEHAKHPVALHLSKAQSGATIAKAYLDALGVQPRLQVQPDFPKPYLGYAAQAYYGGRVEARIVKVLLQCVYLDFLSMYPTVFALLGLWSNHIIPANLEVEEVPPEEIAALLMHLREYPETLFNPATWRRLDFFALVDPNGANLPARAPIVPPIGLCPERLAIEAERRDYEKQDTSNAVVTIGPVESVEPLWYAGPDLAASAIADGKPVILRAWRLRPNGIQESLRAIPFRGADLIDPRSDDFFARLIELRKTVTGDAIDDERRSSGYKVVANSGAYGVFAETSPIDVDPDERNRKLRRVSVYADSSFETEVDRPERPGRFNFFPTASLVTAGARLMLALAQREVEGRGGDVAYCDTDSLVVVATHDGGFVPCEGGPYRLPNGSRGLHALSWEEVETIRERFASLSPYNRTIAPGSVLKLEDENFVDKRRTARCELCCYAVSEKLYALFTLDKRGEPVIRKYSSHVLGQYRSPIQGDRHEWIIDAWKREIRAALGRPTEAFAWEQYPAISQLTLTTWNVFEPYRENDRLRPFDFLAVGVVNRSAIDLAIEEVAGLERCCEDPRPGCPLFSDPKEWREQDWRCLRCEAPWDFELRPRLKTYGSLIRSTLRGVERKRLCADGSEPTRRTRGLLIPRPVHVESKEIIGKEVIVDPTDTAEGLTAEMLSATEVLLYENATKRLDALRTKIRATGIKLVARASGVSRSEIQAIINEGAIPQESTITRLEGSLGAPGAEHSQAERF
jgi:hypothetical protein